MVGGKGHLPMQHLWQPFVSGILVVKANLLRRENRQVVVTTVLKSSDDVYNQGSWPELLLFLSRHKHSSWWWREAPKGCTAGASHFNSINESWRSHLGRILSGKRWVWNWAASPGFFSCSNSPMRLWEYSWKVFPRAGHSGFNEQLHGLTAVS